MNNHTLNQDHSSAMTVMFDTLAFSKKLKAADMPDRQAEALAEAMAELIDEKLATKHDLHELENNLRRDIKVLENKMDNIEERLTYKLTFRLGSLMVVGFSVLAILIKIL